MTTRSAQAADSPTRAFRVFGIRHHGPGSARALRTALVGYRPDAVLIEGPPEADSLLSLIDEPDMVPPVALLAYVPGEPQRAAFWPFAEFSGEWQAIRYASAAGVPVRFCDLPAADSLAREEQRPTGGSSDPLGRLAAAAGYDDAERWWEDVIEHRDGPPPFDAVAEAMVALRADIETDPWEARREAYMRRTLRRTLEAGGERVAVVCGAWHVPALADPAGWPSKSADDRLLRGRPGKKATATWVPWTHGRLASSSGYGAGVEAPGWYHHLFTVPDRPVSRWLTAAARVLREEDLPISSAHVIEAIRLAETLAALRGRPLAGLTEVTDAAHAALCSGDDLTLELIQRRMVVGERLGSVPASTPMVPLQRDVTAAQRRLRLPPSALDKDVDLDLRRPIDGDRSRLLHRLRLLGVEWGTRRESYGTGTFRESWTLLWRPEFDVDLIEASAYGTTVEDAAAAKAASSASDARSLAELTGLAEACLLADVDATAVLATLADRSARDTDVVHLMAALPALVRASRYGDVRGTAVDALRPVIRSVFARIIAGLPAAAGGLDDDAAAELVRHIDAVNGALALVPERREEWLRTLGGLAGRPGLHSLVDGRCTRLLLDADVLPDAEVEAAMSRAVSVGSPPASAAAWVEGFLSGSGLLLVHDRRLLALADTWIAGLPADSFDAVLPLLRRTFGAFTAPERRAIGERVRGDGTAAARSAEPGEAIDDERAAPAVRTVRRILEVA